MTDEKTVDLLTREERCILQDLGDIASRMAEIVGQGPSRGGDIAEVVSVVHVLQNMILSQAACRAYPGVYRLLGE